MGHVWWLLLFAACDAGAPPHASPSPSPPPHAPGDAAPTPVLPALTCRDVLDPRPTEAVIAPTDLHPEARHRVAQPNGPHLVAHEIATGGCLALEPSRLLGDVDVEKLPTGLDVLASAAAYKHRLRCDAPEGLDFTRERAVIFRFRHMSSEEVTFSSAVEDHGRIKVMIETADKCQGIAPVLERGVVALAVPRTPEPVDLVFCSYDVHCGGDIP